MKSREKAAMLEAIRLAALKVNVTTQNLLTHTGDKDYVDDDLFKAAKDAHNEWCKAVDWYSATRRVNMHLFS